MEIRTSFHIPSNNMMEKGQCFLVVVVVLFLFFVFNFSQALVMRKKISIVWLTSELSSSSVVFDLQKEEMKQLGEYFL